MAGPGKTRVSPNAGSGARRFRKPRFSRRIPLRRRGTGIRHRHMIWRRKLELPRWRHPSWSLGTGAEHPTPARYASIASTAAPNLPAAMSMTDRGVELDDQEGPGPGPWRHGVDQRGQEMLGGGLNLDFQIWSSFPGFPKAFSDQTMRGEPNHGGLRKPSPAAINFGMPLVSIDGALYNYIMRTFL